MIYSISLVVLVLLIVIVLGLSIKKPKLTKRINNSLVISLIAAVSATFITPAINKKVEYDRMRSEFIVENLKNLKKDTLDSYYKIQDFTSCGKNTTEQQKRLAAFKKSKLAVEYRVLEIETIFGKSEHTENLKKTLQDLSNKIKTKGRDRIVLINNYVKASENLFIYLVDESNLLNSNIKYNSIYHDGLSSSEKNNPL